MDSPFFTCIVLSHNKPEYVVESIDSLVRQSFQDWEAIVFDSGDLYDQGFFDDLAVLKDPRFRLLRSWETEEMRRTKTIASWCFNECFRKELVRGRYITYLCDDDILYPNAYETFHEYLKDHPEEMAVYASIDMTVINQYGEKYFLWEHVANEVKGRCCNGGVLHSHVDYLQLCHHIDILKIFPSDEYWSEDRAVMHEADGVFLEQIGEHFPIVPVNVKIGENRKLPESLNYGGEHAEMLAERCRKAELEKRLRRMGKFGRWLLRSGMADWYRSLLLTWRHGVRRNSIATAATSPKR